MFFNKDKQIERMSSLEHVTVRSLDSAYQEFLSSLISILIERLIKFYQNEQDHEALFRQELLAIQQSLHNYQTFKTPLIKYSPMIDPLLHMLEDRIYTYNSQHLEPPHHDTLIKLPRKKVYSSKQTFDPQRTYHRPYSIDAQHTKKNAWNPYYSHEKIGNTTVYLPEVEERRDISEDKRSISEPKARGKEYRSHNFSKEINKAYDRIIGSVINSKGFRRRKYQNKVEGMLRISERSQVE